MKSIINLVGNEAKIFARTFEHEAYDQIKKLINFEAYQNQKIRIMPDAHAGKGCVVGTTMQIADKITPNLVGVDIGCSMLTVKLKVKELDFEQLDTIIKNRVPAGFNVHSRSSVHRPKEFDFTNLRCKKHVDLNRAMLSLGSLGGGNHFIELGKSDLTGELFLIIHSGSRKLGGDTCKYYQDLAFQNVNEMVKVKEKLVRELKAAGRAKDIETELKKLTKPSADKELAFLEGADFQDYINDVDIVQKFASENRKKMAEIILKGMKIQADSSFETIHNYIDVKRMILRKGAVSSELGEIILIPINMRDGSLVCKGKGNQDWNYSAPHGAGRLMSRTVAKQSILMDDFKDSMVGIYSTSINIHTLDEAPQAYKPISEIMELITDTADVIDVIKPLYNFKAH